MRQIKFRPEQFTIAKNLLKWVLLVMPLSVIVGSLVALFLVLLQLVTEFRWAHEWLLFLLPLAGVSIHFLYKLWGKNAEAGNNLIVDEIHQPGGGVPARMAPLIILTTVVTHLFGGSAGREGTAVQIGGSMANLLAKWYKLSNEDLRILLMAGMSAGFGAVFGTPVTGAIFALEVLAIGRIKYDALVPCLVASILADVVCSAWGIHHTAYHILFEQSHTFAPAFIHFDFPLLGRVVLAGIAFGLASLFFIKLTHIIKTYANRYLPKPWIIPVIGGLIIIALVYVLGTRDYLGLGVTAKTGKGISIVNAFKLNGVTQWSWFWKLLFTAITLGTGFKGGEVTPFFFIGAALGNTLAIIFGAPVDLFAGLGFIAVFAGATNTPLACTLMGVELFGGEHLLYYAVACFTAYYFSGHKGIYSSQRVSVPKHSSAAEREEKTMRKLKDNKYH